MNTVNLQEIGLVAWLGGIIDGEGSINMLVSKRKSRDQFLVDPRVIVGNTDPAIIEKTIAALDAIGVGRYVRHDRPKPISFCGRPAFKQMITVYVSGHLRVKRLLEAVMPHLVGLKLQRAKLLKTFIDCRLTDERRTNRAYTKADVDNILAFLAVTKCRNIEHLTKLLNEHTRETRVEHRNKMRKVYKQSAKDRGYIRPSRRALNSHESVRTD